MDKELRDAWVAALRSGEYKQARGTLREDYGFCCLGVLCDLAVKRGVFKGGWREIPCDNGHTIYDFVEGETGYHHLIAVLPPIDLLMRVSLPQSAAEELAHYNDTGMSFDGIANKIIERDL